MKIWNEKFPKCHVLNWKFFVPVDFDNKTFQIFIFWRKTIFQKLSFWVQFLLRNQISIKNSHLKKNVLTQFAPQKTTNFPHFVLILKGMILKRTFSLKIRVWNESFEKKESDSEANFLLQNEILNWKFFNVSDFELRIFCPGRFRKQNFSNNHVLGKNVFQ